MSLRYHHLILVLTAAACASDSAPEPTTPDAATAAEAVAPEAPAKGIIAGELIVKLAQPLTTGVAVVLGGHRVVPVMMITDGTWLVRLDVDAARTAMPLPELTMVAIADVSRVPGVRYAHPNHLLELSRVPNDEYATEQAWHHRQIQLENAWDLTTGPVNSHDVRIAVIDSGSTAHPDSVWAAGANFIASPPDTNTLSPTGEPHGGMVGGLIGARTNNTIGVAGVCWSCSIIPVRAVAGTASGSGTAAVAAGLLWAAGLRDLAGATPNGAPRAQVANLSFNAFDPIGCDADETVRDAIAAATAKGVTVVVSAGNYGTLAAPANLPRFPANCPGVIAVAASNAYNRLAGYSNRGTGIDVTAPGGAFGAVEATGGSHGHGVAVPAGVCPGTSTATGGIVSTSTEGTGHCYRQSAGTSYAAPHVSGVIGLMLAVRPTLTPAQIKAVLRLTASPVYTLTSAGFKCANYSSTYTDNDSNACGAGLLHAYNAVDAINDGAPAIAETTPSYHDFGTVTGSATRTVALRNIGFGDTLASTGGMELIGSSTWFRFGGACSGQSCAQSYTLVTGAATTTTIVCEPTGAGTQTAELRYHHTGVGQARVQLSCTGTATGNLSVPASLALGNVRVNTSAFVGLPLQNTGSAPLTVTNVTFNHSVFTLGSAMPQTINAGGTFNAIVYCTPTAVTTYTATITVASSVGNRTLPVTCTGVAPLIAVAPSPVAFGSVPVGSVADRVVTISNAGGAPLTISSTSLPAPFTFVTAMPTSIAANSSRTVTIRCTPPSAGDGTFRIESDAINAPTLDTSLSCTGAIGIPTVLPNPLAFGGVYVGTSADRTVTVRNDGNAPLTISNAFFLAGTTCVRVGALPPPLAPNASGTFTVRCTPPTEGNHSATLRAVTDGGNVDVVVSVTGIISRIVVSPLAIDYGVVEVGGQAPRDVTILSTGTAALSVSSIVASGGAFSVTNQAIVLPPGTSAVITPRCSPVTTGTVTGWIEVRSNAGDRRVDLTCTGGQAQLSAPTWIELPEVLLGGATTALLGLSNPGNLPLTISSATLTGGNGFTFTGMPTTIAPGATAIVTVRCSPSVAGHVTGSLQIASNAATSPTSIGIGCRAATGRITVLDGSNLELGWCESGTVTIQNSGVGPLVVGELRFRDSGMSTSGIALPATLEAGEITSWQVDCACWKPGFSKSAKQSAKHDGLQEGSFGTVTCGVDTSGVGDTIELPMDPTN